MEKEISVTTRNAQAAPQGIMGSPAGTPAVSDGPPVKDITRALHDAFRVLYARIGAAAEVVNLSLKQKTKDIADCTDLLNGLKAWNTPPIIAKTPPDSLNPANQDRINKTDALYLNGISIPDNNYDAVRYAYGSPPSIGYSRLPIPTPPLKAMESVPGQVYDFGTAQANGRYQVCSNVPPLGYVFDPVIPPISSKTQKGTDFSSCTPGDLVQDLDTGRYYRVSNAKTGVEVTGYPLQKFIQSPNDDVISSLIAQINQKISASSDLSKGDSLEVQKLSGQLNTVVTTFVAILEKITAACNAIISNSK